MDPVGKEIKVYTSKYPKKMSKNVMSNLEMESLGHMEFCLTI